VRVGCRLVEVSACGEVRGGLLLRTVTGEVGGFASKVYLNLEDRGVDREREDADTHTMGIVNDQRVTEAESDDDV